MLIGDLGILFCSILWAASFSAVKYALTELTPFWIMTARFGISLICLVLMAPRRIKTVTAGDWLRGLAIGGAFIGALLCQAMGLKKADTGTIAFLTAGYVALLPFLLLICRRHPAKVDYAAAALCLLGMAFLSLTPGQSLDLGPGSLWGFGSALCAALQVLNIELLAKKSHPIHLCLTQLTVGFVTSLAAAFFWEGPVSSISAGVALSTIYLALGCTLVPFFLQLVAQPLTSPTRASLIYSLESVFAGLIGVIWLNEALTSRKALGCGLIFASVLLAQLLAPAPREKTDDPTPDLMSGTEQ